MQNTAFGRKIKITIYAPDNELQTDAYVFESEFMKNKRGFKIVGSVSKYFAIQPPEATIDIYNLSPVEMANIMLARYKKIGDTYCERELRVRIEAGYTLGKSGIIFDGQILKPNMVKPDPNNNILRLSCIDGANFIAAGSILTQTFNDGMNFYTVAEQIKKNNNYDFSLILSENLKNITVDGSFVSENSAFLTLSSLAEETGCVFSYKDGTASIQTLSEMLNSEQDAYVLNAQTGLIGIPMLSSDGVSAQTLLNPNIDVLSIIKIDNSQISINQPEFLNNRQIGAWLSGDGLYRVIRLTHEFDTTTGLFTTNMNCLARNYYNLLS